MVKKMALGALLKGSALWRLMDFQKHPQLTRGPKRIPPVLRDIPRWFPDYSPNIIFDVGANIGSSCLSYAQVFPGARIHAFEPVPATYAKLKANVAAAPSITSWQIALSSVSGTVVMRTVGTSTANRILAAVEENAANVTKISTMTGLQFCREHQIERISFLKIDTEGHDLHVLRGFEEMLDRIEFVQVEAGANSYNRTHVPFRDLEDFFRERGFYLFHHYDQIFEFSRGGRPVLRRSDVVFINKVLVDLEDIH